MYNIYIYIINISTVRNAPISTVRTLPPYESLFGPQIWTRRVWIGIKVTGLMIVSCTLLIKLA